MAGARPILYPGQIIEIEAMPRKRLEPLDAFFIEEIGQRREVGGGSRQVVVAEIQRAHAERLEASADG